MRHTTLRLICLAILLLSTTLLYGQDNTNEPRAFNGLITTPDGKGVKANIEVKNRDKTTRSDKKGRFGLTDINPDDTLLITIKKQQLTIPVDGRCSINITINHSYDNYNAYEDVELANIGFGYVKRRESTSFSSGISGDRLRATGCNNIMDAIAICYPALHVINGELCLRSANSVLGSSAVLVLCDGVETNIHAVSLHDVESVEILKDSTIYGFRGVNGVVLITTKS